MDTNFVLYWYGLVHNFNQIICFLHRLLNYCLLVFVFRALIESMNFADKPIDEALRNLQEVFQITVSTCIVYHSYCEWKCNLLFDLLAGRSTTDRKDCVGEFWRDYY